MPEHLIRFRGGWEWVAGDSGAEAARRVTLPIAWPHGLADPVRLVRAFARPPIDPCFETISLRLRSVAGLISARLNDREIARPTAGSSALAILLEEPLPARNVLVLEVDPARASASTTGGSPWGEIALVIRRVASEPPDRSGPLGETGPSA